MLVGSTDATLDINVTPSDLLFVYDGSNASLFPEYRNSLNNLGLSFVEWNIDHYLGSPNEELLDQFSDPLTMIWIAGGDTSSQLGAGDIPLLETHLSKGNRLIMAGRNIVEFEDRLLSKRVVGLPGETIEITEGSTIIDGKRIEEHYVIFDMPTLTFRCVLSEDEYFVMGDNRSNSNDSRFFGPVKKEQIIKEVKLIIGCFK